MAHPDPIQLQKVRKIFAHFDLNKDGRLSREEMAALVVAVNPRVNFSPQQVGAILDEVFRTYQDFIHDPEGLSLDGLLRTYEDGAGDVARDFLALKLELNNKDSVNVSAMVSSIVDERVHAAPLTRRKDHMPTWAPSNIVYDSTWLLVEDLQIIVKRLEAKMSNVASKRREGKALGSESFGSSEFSWSNESSVTCRGVGIPTWEELGQDYYNFQKELTEITQKADGFQSSEEVFDAHIAIGWTLFDHFLYKEALASFEKARDVQGNDPRPHFHLGNTLYSLGKFHKARECYVAALGAAATAENALNHLIPQIHVNLGIAMEGDGMLLSACKHYKKATTLSPQHYRALKLLGSALYGLGEYREAEKALTEATRLKPEFADAHCDLGSTVHAIGEEDERAIREFQVAVDLQPDHMEALYNLGGLFKDIGMYRKAADMYAKVLLLQPNHWRAQLNKGVTLLGLGETEEGRKAFKEAFKINNRVELYDAIMHLKLAGKRPKGLGDAIKEVEGNGSPNIGRSLVEGSEDGVIVAEISSFRQANKNTTPCQWLNYALDIRHFQKQTRLDRCSIFDIKKELNGSKMPASSSARKDELELLLRRLLHFLKPDTFQGAVKAINERVLSALDQWGSGSVSLGMFFAVLAPICGGLVEERKRAAFDFLVGHASKGITTEIPKADVSMYLKLLRAIYIPTQGASQIMELHGETEEGRVSFSNFEALFDDPDWGFGILDVVVKLEGSDRIRHDSQICVICSYTITGPWFKEVTSSFSLCSLCYSEGKVPLSAKKEEYCFKEYNSEVEVMKDKLWLFSLRSSSTL